MVDGLGLIDADGDTDLSVNQADIALGAAVKSSLVGKPVINPDQPGVFVYGGANVVGELIKVRDLVGGVKTQTASCCAWHKVGVWEDDFGCAASNCPRGLAPWKALENGAHFWRGP